MPRWTTAFISTVISHTYFCCRQSVFESISNTLSRYFFPHFLSLFFYLGILQFWFPQTIVPSVFVLVPKLGKLSWLSVTGFSPSSFPSQHTLDANFANDDARFASSLKLYVFLKRQHNRAEEWAKRRKRVSPSLHESENLLTTFSSLNEAAGKMCCFSSLARTRECFYIASNTQTKCIQMLRKTFTCVL